MKIEAQMIVRCNNGEIWVPKLKTSTCIAVTNEKTGMAGIFHINSFILEYNLKEGLEFAGKFERFVLKVSNGKWKFIVDRDNIEEMSREEKSELLYGRETQ